MELLDAKGQKVAESSGAEGELMVEHATLWQPGHAYLYQVRVTFGDDVYELPYDVRTVRVDGERFLINGRPFYFKGYGKHEDTFPAGRGENLPMDVKDISLMKWQGANSFRSSHYPYSEEMMRLCDAEGIVVIDETTAVGVNLKFGGGANFGGEHVSTFDPVHGVGSRPGTSPTSPRARASCAWQATRRASLPATASPSSQLTTSANAGTRSPI